MNTSSLLPPPTISITLPVRIILFQHLVEPVSDSLPLTILVSTEPGHLWNLKLLGQSQQIKELIMRHTTNVTDTEPRKISITGKGYNQNMMVFVVFPQSIIFFATRRDVVYLKLERLVFSGVPRLVARAHAAGALHGGEERRVYYQPLCFFGEGG